MRQATKQEEHNTLLKISEMIAELGPDSYIGAAFEGCIELAQQNIADDALCSMRQRWQAALIDSNEKLHEIKALEKQNAELLEKISSLQKQLEREEEWKPYVDKDAMSDEDYTKLAEACESRMTNSGAKDYLSESLGFARDRIEICYSKFTYEVNRHRTLRVSGQKECYPYYYASDWNYIRFKCGGYTWELVNDELYKVSD